MIILLTQQFLHNSATNYLSYIINFLYFHSSPNLLRFFVLFCTVVLHITIHTYLPTNYACHICYMLLTKYIMYIETESRAQNFRSIIIFGTYFVLLFVVYFFLYFIRLCYVEFQEEFTFPF